MKRFGPTVATLVALAMSTAVPAARAAEAADAMTFHLGLTAVSNFNALRTAIEDNNPNLTLENLGLGIGLSFSAFKPVGNGLSVGGAVGPIIAAVGDASFVIVPLSLGIGYRFGEATAAAAYVRMGAEKAFVNGDFVANASAGGMAAIGYESAPNSVGGMGWGLELGYHGSQVAVAATPFRAERKVKPYEYSLTAFLKF